ncbi:MAG: M20/M25/M40 family metallo-hydrolase, partial [Chromatiales bacterium]|nr:M20/M25/M40 family metallo-hydrolase [Chromatiales bacterium]
MKRGLRFVVSVSALLIAVLAVNALRLESRQIEPVQPSRIEVDAAAAAGRLAAALKFATVSEEAGAQSDASAFAGLVDYLANTYPAVHRMLRPEKIGEGSILYVWQGSDNELEPILLLAHLDVVPVAPDEATSWTQPPFAGNVAEGFVWGRG